MSTGGRQNMWKGHQPIRRQKSCIEMTKGQTGSNSNGNGGGNTASARQVSVLRKQYSVENNGSAGGVGAESFSQKQSVMMANSVRSEDSLRIISATNKRNQSNGKNDQELSERLKKALNRQDSRINLNIFLSHNLNVPETDGISDSENPTTDSSTPLTNKENMKRENNSMNLSNISTAAIRRAQFQASRGTGTVDSKPPLVRAMSAPIRSFDESTRILQNKRKFPRRKKLGRDRDDYQVFINQNCDDDDEEEELSPVTDRTSIRSFKTLPKNKNLPRARSALGCDIVTLVSLLSSGGSDSEREDAMQNNNNNNNKTTDKVTKRAPSLRKTGKSVSFQDNVLQNVTTTSSKDLSTMFRRGSIAPLAAKIRTNRPPTAPPGSIFITDFLTNDNMKSSSKQQSVKSNMDPSRSNLKTAEGDNCNQMKEFENNPENLKTAKEKECWKLFQKMSNRGISVSYDTILRGMLTPTELRILEKQKELALASEAAAEGTNNEIGSSVKAGSNIS